MRKEKLEKIWNTDLVELIEETKEGLQDYPNDVFLIEDMKQYSLAKTLLEKIQWKTIQHEYINDRIPTETIEVSEKDFCIAAAKAANGGDFDKIILLAGIKGCNGKNYNGSIYYKSEKIEL